LAEINVTIILGSFIPFKACLVYYVFACRLGTSLHTFTFSLGHLTMLLAVLMANLLYPTVIVIVTEIDYGPFKDLGNTEFVKELRCWRVKAKKS